MLLKTDTIDEEVTSALGFTLKSTMRTSDGKNSNGSQVEIQKRYTMQELLQIFKNTGRFDHPLTCMTYFKLDEDDLDAKKILGEITNKKPNVLLHLLNLENNENSAGARPTRDL